MFLQRKVSNAIRRANGTLKKSIKSVYEKKKSIDSRCITTVHEGKKEFSCAICGNSYKVQISLNRHLATVHDGKELIEASFLKETKLTKNISRIHKKWIHPIS